MARFQPGCPPGPGRPRGAGSPEGLAAKAIRPHLQSLTEKLVAAGLRGDALAAAAIVSLYAAIRRKM